MEEKQNATIYPLSFPLRFYIANYCITKYLICEMVLFTVYQIFGKRRNIYY